MISFITSREDYLTSAIEIAQVKRLKMFDAMHQPSQIVELEYNFDHDQSQKKLGVVGRVINIFQYYQRLDYEVHNDDVANKMLFYSLVKKHDDDSNYRYDKSQHVLYKNDQKALALIYSGNQIRQIQHFDHFGFKDRVDWFDDNVLTYSEFFEDKGRVVTRQYYDNDESPVISFYYRGGQGNVPVLTMIELRDNGICQFDSLDEFRAHFLDDLVEDDEHAALISDRSDYALKAFSLMQNQVPRYQVFHSSFTLNGQPNGQIFNIYQLMHEMYKKGQLSGLISATKREALDAKHTFKMPSFHVPVTYVSDKVLKHKVDFARRTPGQLIAVARLSAVKQLNHLVQVVIKLKKVHPNVDLKIYGFGDSWNNFSASNLLKKLVHDNHAENYIHFCGYQHNLTKVYETAQIEVLTSQYEGFAMALLEAQSHACPVVSYDICYGPSEIIEDRVSGKLVKANDQDQLYQILDQLLSHPKVLKAYSSHAQKAASKYSFENVTKIWQNFLQDQDLWVDYKDND